MLDTGIDREHPPSPGRVRPFRFPSFETARWANGLKVYAVSDRRAPLVQVLLTLSGGAQHDPVRQAGLAALTASLVDEGTAELDALAIAERVERIGGYLSCQADWDCFVAAIGLLAGHLEEGLRLLAEVLRGAVYPEREFERLKNQQLAELQRRRALPSALASDALARLLYGDGVYGNPILGTERTVAALQREQVTRFGRRHVTPASGALILVGDFDAQSALRASEEILGSWSGRPAPSAPTITPPAQTELRAQVVDRPGAPHTELRIGHVGVPRTHPDFSGLQVLNSLLGGKFSSRINLNLRERLGITYGASSTFAQRIGPGPFVVGASVDTPAVGLAAREIIAELQRLQQEPVRQHELADTQSYLLGVFPYTLQTVEGLAGRIAELAVYDLPDHYFQDHLARIATIQVEDIQRLARDHLSPERAAVVAVGPRGELEGQLADLGELGQKTSK